ncbi:MAG TPA: thioredoxin domain-containing protein [Gemmatimonadaceae bacterium]|nr:thioredoxin domain-containing protein [Gemmatimonadaceae bacterium]
MRETFEKLTTGLLALAAVVIAVTLVHREFFATPPAAPSSAVVPVFRDDWQEFARVGVRSDTGVAKVQIVEFADFECPFCATYEPTLQKAEERYRGAVSRVFVHYPLEIHRFAKPAARAAECAAELGAFAAMRDALYAKQDSFGLRPWQAYARDAGIKDLASFQRCNDNSEIPARVQQGADLALKLKIRGTPTLVINGWEYAGGPPDSVLYKAIDSLMVGKNPPGAVGKGDR